MTFHKTTRRQFLKGLLAGALLPAAILPARAALPALAEDDATAKSLGYVTAATRAQKDAAFRKGSSCASCALYQAAQEEGGQAPCAIFPGKAVAKGGWCRAWAQKPA